jgi:hypothetical protein
MDGTIRVMFPNQGMRDRFFEFIDRYEYRPVYDNGHDRPVKEVGWLGDHMGNCRIYLARRSVVNFQRLGQDIQVFGGRIEL